MFAKFGGLLLPPTPGFFDQRGNNLQTNTNYFKEHHGICPSTLRIKQGSITYVAASNDDKMSTSTLTNFKLRSMYK